MNYEKSINEVPKSVMNAKNVIAGIDIIQARLFKNVSFSSILHNLFNLCVRSGLELNMWNKGIITPIYKCATSDPSDPLSCGV